MQPNKFSTFRFALAFSFLALFLTGFVTYTFSQDWTKTYINSGIVAVFIIIIFLITRVIWLPEGQGKIRVRIITAGIAILTIGAYTGFQNVIQDILSTFLGIPNLGEAVHPLIIFAFSTIIIFIINYFNRDSTAMGKHPDAIDKDIPERDFKERLKSVCISLAEDLRGIDIKTNWSIQNFVPLQAEVELQTDNGVRKKVTDLLKAIKYSKDRLFLVLGDPGSGKSVALRKLCQDLAKPKEVRKSNKIPIYINLKEWQVEQKWTEEYPPTIEQLNDFVLTNIKSRDRVVKQFFDRYYERLYENGHLYFVFDSFDEIPAVLDEKDNSPLIKQLSEVIFKFLKGARAEKSQGILSSRIFRKPTQEFQARTRLEIRPFSDEKIGQTLSRSSKFDDELLRQLFKERWDLIPIARNPFMASLIADYVDNNPNQLPRNQSELYESYINNALKDCAYRIEKRGLTKEEIIACSIEMADVMFQEYGLEAPINKLKIKVNNPNVEDTVDILKFARIGRVGTGDENLFSFAHRRFCEYFAVQKLLQEDKEIDLNTIPEDSQWRDALVLYCEVANEEKATAIANFCWQIIESSKNPYDLRVIHSLRFLQDAFKGRLQCIEYFRKELANFVLNGITEGNTVTAKLAIESLGLLEENDLQTGLIRGFQLGKQSTWISETAFKSCRHLQKLSDKLLEKLLHYLNDKSIWFSIYDYKQTKFSLSLSDSLETPLSFIKYKRWSDFLSLILMLGTLFFIFIFFDIFSLAIFAVILLSFELFTYTSSNMFILFNLKGLKKIALFNLSFTVILTLLLYSIMFDKNPSNDNLNSPYIALFSVLAIQSLGFEILFFYKYFFDAKWTLSISLKEFKDFLKRHSYVLYIFAIFILTFTIFDKDQIKNFIQSYGYVIGIIVVIFFVSAIIYAIIESRKEIYAQWEKIKKNVFFVKRSFNIYKNINSNRCSDREYLSSIFPNLISFHKRKLLAYLEQNVREVKGKWKDINILRMDGTEETTRLAKLEEKWLGLNR